MHQEGVAVALGAQAGHLVTYRDPPPEGALIYTVFIPKSVKNSAKSGYPCAGPVLNLHHLPRGGGCTRGSSSKSKMSSLLGCLAEDNGHF